MSQKKTYGDLIELHRQENHEMEDDVIEYRRQMESSILRDIYGVVKAAKKHPLYLHRDFYVVLLIKNEKIGEATRTFAFARRSCPTPLYKQAVWKYHNNSDSLEFLWSIPDKILYYHIVRNANKYLNDKECASLAKFVILMESGELLKWVKSENGEKTDAVITINTEEACLIN